MLMYMFNPDRDGDAVRDALTDAARRGVDVKLLIDGFGSAATPEFFAELAEAGGAALRVQPELRPPLPASQPPEADRHRRADGADRRREHRRRPISTTAARSTGATCGFASTGPRRCSRPLFRRLVPLVEAARARSSAR